MTQGRYRISVTSGSLYHRESVKLAELYLSLRDWEDVRTQACMTTCYRQNGKLCKRTCRGDCTPEN